MAVPGTSIVWAAQGSYLARSTNLATSWISTVNMGSGNVMIDVDANDGTNAWAVGRYGVLKQTTNSGASWSTVNGITGTRAATGVLALGADDAFIIAEGSTTGTMVPGTGPPDYGDAGATWGGAAGLFGICLRAAPATGSTWPTTGTCTTSDGTNWRGLPDHGGAPEAPAASTLAAGTTTASFRFGMKVPAALPADTYRAPITFEVVAPAG